MAKKKNTGGLLWGIIASVGAVLQIFPMFLVLFQNELVTYTLFAETLLLENPACLTIISVCAIIGLVLACLYALLYILNLTNVVKASLAKYRKILALLSLLVFLIILICGIVFMSTNSTAELVGGIGFYFAVIGTIATGVFGFMECRKK